MSSKQPAKPLNPQSKSSSAIVSAATDGPLPVAQQFEYYEKLLPGAAERIIAMAEKEQENKFLNDKKIYETNQQVNLLNKEIIKNNHKEKMWGIVAAIFICTLIIFCGFYSIKIGYVTAGATIITTTLAGIIAAFVGSRWKDKADS
ncbi:MAG: DUF2335 domain-containing protein [Neisseriaceae bacterium]